MIKCPSNLLVFFFATAIMMLVFPLVGQNNKIDSLSWWRDSTVNYSEVDRRLFLDKALSVARKNELGREEALTFHEFSYWELRQANFSKALSFLDSVDQVITKYQLEDIKLNTLSLQQRGIIHLNLKQIDKAVFFFKECIAICLDKSYYHAELAASYGNLGIIDYLKGNLIQATNYFEQATPLYTKLNDFEALAEIDDNLALIYLQQNKPKKALAYFLKHLDYFKNNSEQLSLVRTYGNLGYTYSQLNNIPQSLKYYNLSIEIAKAEGFNHALAITYKDLSETYETIGESNKALEIYKNFHETHTKNVNEQSLKEVSALQLKYEQEANKRKLAKKEQEIQSLRQDKIIRQQRFYLALIGSLVLLMTSLFFYISKKAKIAQLKTAKQLEEQSLKNKILQEEKQKNALKEQLLYKEKDITSLALDISRKNDFTNSLNEQLLQIEKELPSALQPQLKQLKAFVNTQLQVDEDIALVQNNIEAINAEFYQKLDTFAKLGQSEKVMCGLIRLNLSNKEIALLRNMTPNSTKVARYRIRKKLGLQPEEDIVAFLQKI